MVIHSIIVRHSGKRQKTVPAEELEIPDDATLKMKTSEGQASHAQSHDMTHRDG
jgi:hypothetical protein